MELFILENKKIYTGLEKVFRLTFSFHTKRFKKLEVVISKVERFFFPFEFQTFEVCNIEFDGFKITGHVSVTVVKSAF